jgi:hypothetical protein
MHHTHNMTVCRFCGKIERPGIWEDTSNILFKDFVIAKATEDINKIIILFRVCNECKKKRAERETKHLKTVSDEPQKGSDGG